jgi:acyl carrier protein
MTSHTRDEILESLKGALDRASNGRAKTDHLIDEARIIEDVGLSSLDVLDLRCELEELLKMRITDAELAETRTIGDIVRIVLASEHPRGFPESD